MLRELGIRNFVLIEDLRLSFDAGLNVLTGETGAGKSIVLDALALLSGARFEASFVRSDSERASIDALFDLPQTRAFQSWWKAHDWEAADELLLRREGTPDGKSKAYLNDRPVTAATLAELGEFLIDIHGQHAHLSVLKNSAQRSLLDRFGELEAEAESLAPLFQTWSALEKEAMGQQLSEEERLARLDIVRFQSAEIEKASLRAGEEEKLEARLPELKHGEKLRQGAALVYEALSSGEGSALERLSPAQKALDSLSSLAPQAEEWKTRLSQAALELDSLAADISSWMDRLGDTDPEALEALLSRLDLISRLKKKYGGSLEAVLERGNLLRAELERLENADQHRDELDRKRRAARQALEAACAGLSKKRAKAAKDLSAAVQKQLADLGFHKAVFACQLQKAEPAPHGWDHVEFVWAPNLGEGMQPLKDIASGGEMSRLMLALKTVLAQADAIPVLVFDEVDAGIGGLTAQAVGKKLRALAKHHQVLCVSHLPQIAASAHAHFHVSKRTQKNRTFAVVERLDGQTRLEELARLLGSAVTPVSLQHAKELLSQNQ